LASAKVKAALWGGVVIAVGAIVAALISSSGSSDALKVNPRLVDTHEEEAESSLARTFPMALDSRFFASGWMGDGESGTEYLMLESVDANVAGNPQTATHFTYARGPQGWAGVYWQYPDKNWGTQPGINLTGASRVTFWARGQNGGEIVEFKAGGIRGQYEDSFEKSLGRMALTDEWQMYVIDLSGLDLTSVLGAFAWAAPAPDEGTLSFYVAGLIIE
jgi:hypothetical protein